MTSIEQIIEGTNYVISSDGRLFNSKSKKSKKWTKDTNGYMRCTIWINNKPTTISQHRVLAKYFIPNPYNKPQVNHINGKKHDNRLENLEWTTASENEIHAFKIGLKKVTRPNMKKVINMETNLIHDSLSDASVYYKIDKSTLSSMLNNKIVNKTNLKYY